jgi:SAM-dependent methyltransferase
MRHYGSLRNVSAPIGDSMDYASADFGPLQLAKAQRDAKYFRGCRLVVDLGCGPGHLLGLLRDQGTQAYGVDLEDSSLKSLKQLGLAARRQEALGHLKSLKTGQVDGIHCSNLLEHLPVEKAKELLRLSAAKLAPGGRLLISTSNAACLGVVAGAFWDDEQHVRPYTARLLRSWAEAEGLNVQHCGADEFSRPKGLARSALRALRTMLVGPFFEAPELMVMASKPDSKTR